MLLGVISPGIWVNDSQLTALINYLSDSKVLFGFDPDCHWYNSGIRLDITTQPSRVPDGGATLILLGLGLLGLHQARRFGQRQ